jgi:lipopolysaccharide export LptBFGC system permease protein LptF
LARLSVRGYLVNDNIHPDYEISAQKLIDAFIGDDTGAPLQTATFTLETDDGNTVTITVPFPKQSRNGPRVAASEIRARVEKQGSTEA